MKLNYLCFDQVIQLLEEEESRMSPKHMTDMLNLVKKEEALEMEEKLAKSLVDSGDKHQGSDTIPTASNAQKFNKSQEPPVLISNNTAKKPVKTTQHSEQLPAQKSVTNNVCDVKVDYLFTTESRKFTSKTMEQVKPFLLEDSAAGIRPRSGSQSASL